MSYKKTNFFYFYIIFFLLSCSSNPLKIDVSDVKIDFKCFNFKEDFFKEGAINKVDLEVLSKKYPLFLDAFIYNVLSLRGDSTVLLRELNRFKESPFSKKITHEIDSILPSKKLLKIEFENAFKHYSYYFKNTTIPKVILYFSGYNYAIAVDSSYIAIGLEMFLGKDYKPYQQLRFPSYKVQNMTPNQLIPSSIKGWLTINHPNSEENPSLIDEMIYRGIINYLTLASLPNKKEHEILGYNKKQLEWCKKYEKEVWHFFIKENLLYSKEQKNIITYINDSPSISHFPEGSPGRVGEWVGLQIVKSYLSKHPKTDLTSLFTKKHSLLSESGYKP